MMALNFTQKDVFSSLPSLDFHQSMPCFRMWLPANTVLTNTQVDSLYLNCSWQNVKQCGPNCLQFYSVEMYHNWFVNIWKSLCLHWRVFKHLTSGSDCVYCNVIFKYSVSWTRMTQSSAGSVTPQCRKHDKHASSHFLFPECSQNVAEIGTFKCLQNI